MSTGARSLGGDGKRTSEMCPPGQSSKGAPPSHAHRFAPAARSVMFKRGAFDLGVTVCPIAIKYNKIFVDAFWNRRGRGGAPGWEEHGWPLPPFPFRSAVLRRPCPPLLPPCSRRESFSGHLFRLMTSWAVVADVWCAPRPAPPLPLGPAIASLFPPAAGRAALSPSSEPLPPRARAAQVHGVPDAAPGRDERAVRGEGPGPHLIPRRAQDHPLGRCAPLRRRRGCPPPASSARRPALMAAARVPLPAQASSSTTARRRRCASGSGRRSRTA